MKLKSVFLLPGSLQLSRVAWSHLLRWVKDSRSVLRHRCWDTRPSSPDRYAGPANALRLDRKQQLGTEARTPPSDGTQSHSHRAEAPGRKGLVDVDVLSLSPRERPALLERLIHVADKDNERFLLKLKARGADAGGSSHGSALLAVVLGSPGWRLESARWNA
ncbi:unnamed protein product [Miscanthus lutarioriparius]|uniref:Uncharacterized protein n=1 Tax=Miscanthus lutarioriparius TaxID=422564 RepID=A0A811R2Y5_9POAL|nr:unnamed protein product [Miscanthus lutarioriparius]